MSVWCQNRILVQGPRVARCHTHVQTGHCLTAKHGVLRLCCLVGEHLFTCHCRFKPEKYMQVVFAVAAVALFVPVLYHTTRDPEVEPSQDAPGTEALCALSRMWSQLTMYMSMLCASSTAVAII